MKTIEVEQLKIRIEKALEDFTKGRASMHVPPLNTDVDMGLSDCQALIEGMGNAPVYQMRLLDGSPEETIWVEVSKEEFNTPLKNPSEWEKRILYTAPSLSENILKLPAAVLAEIKDAVVPAWSAGTVVTACEEAGINLKVGE
ncbi:hypothetical protein EXT67_20630 [Pectobacterium atrosepticum]|uniref:Uncharacterized protein n=1 Tax=Pectobacterium phage phiTE TaxID=1116482 RepID=K9L529_9CAUD|nr:hypothetical protein [Pectobacterium atrosepticum]YP_007392531.1 hypothetical protein phiTE_069 [Pectobacterium phage phiTE]AEZ66235.1 hypothetical protein phiTE_069 [Pectobacterium phage phiTE]MCL6318712.1 hypothetical protein [Pectobacterium atrosepticum]